MSAAPQTFAPTVQPAYIQERRAFIPAFYMADQHTEDEYPNIVVREDGTPITVNGITLTVGMTPPERRYAIHRSEGGKAMVRDAREFADLHEKSYRDHYAALGEECDDPSKRHVPNPIEFVSWAIDPTSTDGSQLAPLGAIFSEEAKPPEGTMRYSPEQDRMIPDPEVAGETKALREENETLKIRLDEQAAQIEKLMELATAPAAEPIEEPEVAAPKMEAAPCGKSVKAGYVHAHKRHCKEPACNVGEAV